MGVDRAGAPGVGSARPRGRRDRGHLRRVGISFIGTAWSEPTLIKVASGFEAETEARRKPQFRETLPLDGQGDRRLQNRAARRELPRTGHRLVRGL